MSHTRVLTAVLILFASFFAVSCNGKEYPSDRRGRTIEPDHKVTIYDGDNTIAEVQVALAQTEAERSLGLMDVHEMPFDTGMLFLFDDERPRSFWMVNTPLPLDILFIAGDRQIVRIRTNTTPFSERRITSEFPAKYVLEVNAGFVREYDIREGMQVDWE